MTDGAPTFITVDDVREMVSMADLLRAMIEHRDFLRRSLAEVEFDIHFQHGKLLGYHSSPLLRTTWLKWADAHVPSADPELRSLAFRVRSMLDRNNPAPLFPPAASDQP